jgi:hypothetical protein
MRPSSGAAPTLNGFLLFCISRLYTETCAIWIVNCKKHVPYLSLTNSLKQRPITSHNFSVLRKKHNLEYLSVLSFDGLVAVNWKSLTYVLVDCKPNIESIWVINSVALSPQENYTDWATATCRRNLVPTFVDRDASRGQRGGSPTGVNLIFE